MQRSAVISPCGRYRYALWRRWRDDRPGICMFVMLNPSTADATIDDPTIRRCITFAHSWGYGAIYVLNLFAFRATDPRELLRTADPIGPDNHIYLKCWGMSADIRIAAWGAHGGLLYQNEVVRDIIPRLHYLKLNKDGLPAHPLYLPGSLVPIPWGAQSC